MTPEQKMAAEQGSRYLMLAESVKDVPGAAALYVFASDQLGEFVVDQQKWHALAANAACRAATVIYENALRERQN
jgi:hypothetical protein